MKAGHPCEGEWLPKEIECRPGTHCRLAPLRLGAPGAHAGKVCVKV